MLIMKVQSSLNDWQVVIQLFDGGLDSSGGNSH